MKLVDLFENAVNLNEVLDTKFDSLKWEDPSYSGAELYGTGVLGGEKFRLSIQPSSFTVNATIPERYDFLNIAFSREIDGRLTQDLISTGKSQSRQLGAVVNALKDKILELDSKFDIHAVAAVAAKGEEKRIPFYTKVLSMTHPWKHRYTVSWFGGTALIATKQKLSQEQLDALSAEIKSRNKNLSEN